MLRKKLIETIIDLSADELGYSDLIELASEDTDELVRRLIHIAKWYRDNASN